ncbi:MAG: cytochrome c biogenesis protein CcsA [Alphaproteobacteria bacterium]
MRLLAVLLTLLMCFSGLARAEETLDMSAFKNIPLQHQGRLKPLDSFAKLTLKQLSGQTSLKDLSATNWLALNLFDPQSAAQIPVFKISNDTLKKKIGLPDNKTLLSFNELKPALDKTREDLSALLAKDEKNLDPNERELLRLHENAATLTMLMRSFSALLPLNIELPQRYQKQIEGQFTFTELSKIEQQLQEELNTIIATKGRDPAAYSPEELSIAKTAFHIQMLRAGGENNNLLRVIPSTWKDAKEPWLSPWEVLLGGEGSPASAFLLSQWADLAKAYRDADAQSWRIITAEILDETQIQSQHPLNTKKFELERIYTNTAPYLWILAFYGLGFLTAALSIFKPDIISNKIPAFLALSGIMLHTVTLGARIYILARPPVGTLYESVLFVSLICVSAAAITAIHRKNAILLLAGLAAGTGLLLTAPALAPEADSLEVLAAVLNTNFWLTVHVLCITAGYGACILGAGLAHAALFIRGFKNTPVLWLKLQQNIYHLSLIALLLSAAGTALGGIWADQSWGRFWGWDPKENGALLIVLWLLWTQHGRAANKIKPATFTALIAALNIIVALSWFGVNLLSVGLHSYGFTAGLAGGLFAFCAAELILITTLYLAAKKKELSRA